MTSLLLAVTPLLPAYHSYFVEFGYVAGGPLFKLRVVPFQEAKNWALKLPVFNLPMPSQSGAEWFDRIENAATWENLLGTVLDSKLASQLNIEVFFK